MPKKTVAFKVTALQQAVLVSLCATLQTAEKIIGNADDAADLIHCELIYCVIAGVPLAELTPAKNEAIAAFTGSSDTAGNMFKNIKNKISKACELKLPLTVGGEPVARIGDNGLRAMVTAAQQKAKEPAVQGGQVESATDSVKPAETSEQRIDIALNDLPNNPKLRVQFARRVVAISRMVECVMAAKDMAAEAQAAKDQGALAEKAAAQSATLVRQGKGVQVDNPHSAKNVRRIAA